MTVNSAVFRDRSNQIGALFFSVWRPVLIHLTVPLLVLSLAGQSVAMPFSITAVVEDLPLRFSPAFMDKAWFGSREAYAEIETLLSTAPRMTNDWRNGLDALAAVASGDKDLSIQAFNRISAFATDMKYYQKSDSDLEQLAQYAPAGINPPDDQQIIPPYAFWAKIEAPYAIAILAQLTVNDQVKSRARELLMNVPSPCQWSFQPYLANAESRKQFLADRYRQALQSLDRGTPVQLRNGQTVVLPWTIE